MTLFEELYYDTEDLAKFYRFEGYRSFPYFGLHSSEYFKVAGGYVYFSSSQKHHSYYTSKRLKQIVAREVLEGTNLDLSRETLIDNGAFDEIVCRVRNFSLPDKMLSLECSTLPIMNELLDNNVVINNKKVSGDRRVERVDRRFHHGGYGFCENWLEVFDLLTLFYSHRRITTENMIEFLHLYRRNLLSGKKQVEPTPFLRDSSSLVIGVNPKIYDDFSKYKLMNSLQGIVEDGLYLPGSVFSDNPDGQVRKIVQGYSEAREDFLEHTEKVYQKRLKNVDIVD